MNRIKQYYTVFAFNITTALNYLILLFVFVFPIHYTAAKKLMAVIFALWLFSTNYKKLYFQIVENRFLLSITMFVFFIALTYLWSENTDQAWSDIRFSFRHFYLPILIIVSTLYHKHIRYMVPIFLVSMFINEIISYNMFFFDIKELFGYKLSSFGSSSNPVVFHRSHLTYSVFVAFAILLTGYKIFHEPHKIYRYTYMLFFITMCINLFLSRGRTGQFALLLTLLFLSFHYIRSKKTLILFNISVVLLFCVAYFSLNTFNTRVNAMYNETKDMFVNDNYNSSVGNRLASIRQSHILMDSSNIVFGVGIGDAREIFTTNKQFIADGTNQNQHIHNQFLSILFIAGLVGLVFLLYIYYQLYRQNTKDYQVAFVRLALFYLLLFIGLTGSFLNIHETANLQAVFFAFLILQFSYENGTKHHKPS